MSERKVLNKYYPPDFDPTKIPKIRRPKSAKAGVFSIRLMAPFNMRCNTCGEYIYKGKKFNSRKETVENENYLGLHIFRFYIKCPRCIAEIAFKTDPVNTDYELEAGATRNFEATRTAERMALQEQKEKEAEDASNPMKLLENRTKASCQEMEMVETLEELRELRHRHAGVNVEKMLQQNREEAARQLQLQEQQDEEFVRSIFGHDGTGIVVKRLDSDDDVEDGDSDSSSDNGDKSNDAKSSQHSDGPRSKIPRLSSTAKPSDILTEGPAADAIKSQPEKSSTSASSAAWNRSVGSMKCQLAGLVRPKAASTVPTAAATSNATSAAAVSVAVEGLARTNDNAAAVSSGTTNVKSAGLAGLGAYSSSSSGDSSDTDH